MRKTSLLPLRPGHGSLDNSGGVEEPTPTAKVFALLELLSRRGSARLTDLATELGVPKTTLYRITTQLEQLGYLQREVDSRQLTIAPRLANLSSNILGAATRLAPRHAILEKLTIKLGESCSLGIRVGHHVVYLDDVTAPSPLAFNFQTGQRTPLYCTSTGKLFLANMSAGELDRYFTTEPMIAHTPHTITDIKKLRSLLDQITKSDFACSGNEYVLGVVGAAVPVRNSDDRIFAALTVSIPAARMLFSDLQTLKPALTTAAGELADTFR